MSQIIPIAEGSAAPDPIDGVLDLPAPWVLHHGDRLASARISYRLTGPADAPVVVALGGISAHRIVAAPRTAGWWHTLVGPGLGLDTNRYRVLGIDYLGGRGGSTAPAAGEKFPPLSAWDQAEALAHLVKALRVGPVHAIMGASYGGMVAMAFAVSHPQLTRRIIVVSTADRSQPLATAWRSLQRQIVREAVARGEGAAGLKLARALAMTTYRSPAELAQRFSGPPVRDGDRFRFPIEEYLFARGDEYVRYYRPESFLTLSESIDLFDIDASRIAVPTTLIAVREDQLVPIDDMRALAGKIGPQCRLIEISSICGHDAFLTEGAMFKPIVERILTEA
ncbi:MAG: homoserine O-succinyltransferase [Steroidobacterales bacterium]